MRLLQLACFLLVFTSCRDVAGVVDSETAAAGSLSPALASLSRTIIVGASSTTDGGVAATLSPTAGTFVSLVGYDAFDVEVRNVTRSGIGEFSPGRVRMRAELRVHNVLDRVQLLPSTFPIVPDGVNGLMLLAAAVEAVDEEGSVGVAGGNTVIVRAPSHGRVSVSRDWPGEPFDYQRSTFATCSDPRRMCARYVELPAPLLPRAASPWVTVGFDVEPSVRRVRVRLLLAADLADAS